MSIARTLEPRSPWRDAAGTARLHACRTQDELEGEFSAGVAQLLPGIPFALCLVAESAGQWMVRSVGGTGCPLRAFDTVVGDAWALPDEQRLAVRFGDHLLGQLLLGVAPSPTQRRELEDGLVHLGTALVNITLNFESRQTTEDYCASLQALEEGIVLFQEADAEAVMARLLSLATSMVQATAGVLFVLDQVGDADSKLRLQQALGIPEGLVGAFRSTDDQPWPEVLMRAPAHLARRESDDSIAGLAADSVPSVLREVVVLPLRYHGVQAGLCLLFNPLGDEGKTGDLVGRLQSFCQLAAALLHRLSLESMREQSRSLERELQIAETIQKRLVPSEAPAHTDYDFAWHTIAAKNIGGDYLDFTMSELGDLYAVVADASGHGVNSALLMTSFRGGYRGSYVWREPNDLAALLNDEVAHEVGPTGMFITAALARIEQESRQLVLCSAGHNPVMLFRAQTGAIEAIESHGPPMGFVAGADYEQYTTHLLPGDVLVLYTDGVTEAADDDLEMFGEERLTAALLAHAREGATAIRDAVLTQLRDFTGRDRHDDDVSLLVIKAL